MDPRTLLKTPKSTTIENLENGQYCHFGLQKCIENMIEKSLKSLTNKKEIDLIINIDDTPLDKSSEKNL